MSKTLVGLLVGASLLLPLTGCVSSKSGDVYTRGEVQQPMSFRPATVVSVRTVRMEGTKSGVGTGAGAVAGGVAGSGVGSGKGAVVGAVLGAVVGGVVGSAAEEGFTRADAWELTLKYDSGDQVVIVQEKGNDTFTPGERVKVLTGSRTRVTK